MNEQAPDPSLEARPGTPDGTTPMMAQYLETKAAHVDYLLFYRMGELKALAARLRDLTSHRGLGRNEVRLGGIDSRLFDRDLHAIGLGVEFDQHIAFFHAIVVVHEDASDLTCNSRSDEGDVAVHIRVIRGNGAKRTDYP